MSFHGVNKKAKRSTMFYLKSCYARQAFQVKGFDFMYAVLNCLTRNRISIDDNAHPTVDFAFIDVESFHSPCFVPAIVLPMQGVNEIT